MSTPSEDQATRYRHALEAIVGAFEFQTCAECGFDVDRHTFSPGPFGLPLATCLDPAGDEDDDSPSDTDGWVILDNGQYFVKLGNMEIRGPFGRTREGAIYRLALAMVETGEFPAAWLTGEHGPAVMNIDDEIRALHDEGGTAMKNPKPSPVDPEMFKRTAPNWNCIDYPGGMHYMTSDNCGWCGRSREEIAKEA